jgi:plastocyanin
MRSFRIQTITFLAVTLAAGLLAVPSAALAAGGTISGKVDAVPPKFLPETVVYLKEVPGSTAPKAKQTMDQKGMTFIPHVLAITVGDTVTFLNHDTVAHNVFSPDNETYNLGTFKAEEKAEHVFDKAGAYSQLCSLHPEMLAYIYVAPNSFHAVVDAKGTYKIENVPPGTYKVEIWNPKLKAAEQSATVAEGKTADVNFSLKR